MAGFTEAKVSPVDATASRPSIQSFSDSRGFISSPRAWFESVTCYRNELRLLVSRSSFQARVEVHCAQ